MSEFTFIAGILAGVFGLLAFFPYIHATIKRKCKPNRASWWIWALLGILLSASYHSVGATDTLWMTISYIIGPMTIGILSLGYGTGGYGKFEIGCLIGVIIASLIWWIFNAPFISLIALMIIDGIGFLPTIKKTVGDPYSEDLLAWSLFFLGALLNLFAIEQWTIEVAAYPVWLFIFEVICMSIILTGRYWRNDA